jgi:hypothetical protein
MPQFELEDVGPESFTGLRRGRTPEEAARLAGGIPAEAVLVLAEPDREDWQTVALDGQPAGRIRLHQRMRFRRD